MKTWLQNILTVVGALLLPFKTLLVAIGVLVVIELILTCIIKKNVYKTLMKSTIKLLVYYLVFIAAMIFQHYIQPELLPLLSIIGTLFAVRELKLIFKNGDTLLGTNIYPLIDKFFDKKSSDDTTTSKEK